MTIEQIKENLYSKKVEQILNSDFEYLYRNTCEFIIDQYKIFNQKITDPDILSKALPIAHLENFYLEEKNTQTEPLIKKINTHFENQSSKTDKINLIDYSLDEESKLLALILFKHTKLDWQTIQNKVKLFTIEQQEEIFKQYFQKKTVPKELSSFNYTFELSVDFNQLQKLKQTSYTNLIVQEFSMSNGYQTPPEIIDAGLQGEYIMIMKRALNAFEEMKGSFPQLSKYIIPLAFLQKMLFTIDIIQLSNLQLNIAEQLWEEIKKVHPTVYQGAKNLL